MSKVVVGDSLFVVVGIVVSMGGRDDEALLIIVRVVMSSVELDGGALFVIVGVVGSSVAFDGGSLLFVVGVGVLLVEHHPLQKYYHRYHYH